MSQSTSNESANIAVDLKYDDTNISSMRQQKFTWDHKAAEDTSDVDGEDYTHFEKILAEPGLNSSLKNEASDCIRCCEISAKEDLTITTKPSQSSKGFENTFKILENQVEKNNQKIIQVMHTVHENGSFSAKSIQSNRLETPDRLELEVEPMQRLSAVQSDVSTNIDLKHNQSGWCSKGLPKELTKSTDKLEVKPKDEYGIVYHAARTTDCRNYLKIVNTSLSHKVLCGNRVSQMTRAYDDIEAVTRLLEEKEKDLELTVQIGKELLTQNNALEQRIGVLESDLKTSNDDRAQLLHELHKKNELVAVLTDADDCSDGETPTLSKSITLDLLQKKVTGLQDENRTLKLEVSQLACETDAVEAHERQLMADIAGQLNEANSQFDHVSLELERQREENRLQHEQIVSLTARLAEAEMRLHQLTHDNDEHLTLLSITRENQNSLAHELVEFKQRYQEVLALLKETQEQLRKQRKKSMPQVRISHMSSGVCEMGGNLLVPESLQSELMEYSLYSDNSLDSGICVDSQRANERVGRLMAQTPHEVYRGIASMGGGSGVFGNEIGKTAVGISGGCGAVPPYKRVFETVRCAAKNGNYAEGGDGGMGMSQIGAMSMSSASGPRMSASACDSHPAGSYYRPSGADGGHGLSMGVRSMSSESLASQSDDDYPSQPYGVPGAPGAKDLEAALKRLSPAEVLARRAMLSYGHTGTYSYDDPQPTNTLPLGERTPDSIMSTGSSGVLSSNMSSSLHQWSLPAKLQIVKPIEGSQTLHQWSRLATPTLSGLLEERPGVTVRGGRGLDDLGMQVYTLSDVEEDVSDELPGKQFENAGCTYTFTTSVVMHPDDGFVNDLSFLSHSQMSSRVASTSTSRQPSCPPTPRGGLSRKNSCSTFSVNLGLASMLSERGIKAVTPSVFNTPTGANFSPTVTPCNSPEGSPTRSMSPEPLFGLWSWGGDMIRRRLVGGEIERPHRRQQQQQQKRQQILLSRLERRALHSLKLVEKVESIGLENIIAQPGAASQMVSGIANRSSSPMTQLTRMQMHSNASSSGAHSSLNSFVDDVCFDREQIRVVVHRGLSASTPQPHAQSESLAVPSCRIPSAYNSDSEAYNKMASTTMPRQAESAAIRTTVTPATKSKAEPTAPSNTANATDTTRAKQMQRQKSRRNLKNGIAAQRPDLGTIGGRVRSDLGSVAPQSNDVCNVAEKSVKEGSMTFARALDDGERSAQPPQSITQSFVGSVSSLLFGRKGGWL